MKKEDTGSGQLGKMGHVELRSRQVLEKPEWSSVRALYKGMGYEDDELDRPQIGIFNTYSSAEY